MLPFLTKTHHPVTPDILTNRGNDQPLIDSDDALARYLAAHPEVVDIHDLEVESPGLKMLKDAGVRTIVPLVAQGELVGMISLGQRRSEQDYSHTDRRLLNRLGTHAAMALKVAGMANSQQEKARLLERMENDLRVAQVIQRTLLPKSIPIVEGWKIGSHWKPAQAIGGDFYDFIEFPDGQLGIIAGDVTDKGVAAALVMAETRSILRAVAMRYRSPGHVLARVNDILGPDIPDRMFITCIYALIDPFHGHLRVSNAGHNLPIFFNAQNTREVMVRGMPLGIFPGMEYEEIEMDMQPGTTLVLYSDGITEAHNPAGEIYGSVRMMERIQASQDKQNPIGTVLADLESFTGGSWEQEDDITMVIAAFEEMPESRQAASRSLLEELFPGETAHVLTEFSLPSMAGTDRTAMEKVVSALEPYSLNTDMMQRIRTAVAETALNAIEHGNQYQPELPVTIQVLTSKPGLAIRVTDCGEKGPIPEMAAPDLSAKLEGTQSSRGWGLFLIKSMSDDMRIVPSESGNTVELVYKFK